MSIPFVSVTIQQATLLLLQLAVLDCCFKCCCSLILDAWHYQLQLVLINNVINSFALKVCMPFVFENWLNDPSHLRSWKAFRQIIVRSETFATSSLHLKAEAVFFSLYFSYCEQIPGKTPHFSPSLNTFQPLQPFSRNHHLLLKM